MTELHNAYHSFGFTNSKAPIPFLNEGCNVLYLLDLRGIVGVIIICLKNGVEYIQVLWLMSSLLSLTVATMSLIYIAVKFSLLLDNADKLE